MTSVQDNSALLSTANPNVAPPIDLNALHTPYKLASFVVNVPTRKQEYSFLFNGDNTTNLHNSSTNNQYQFNNNAHKQSLLNPNNLKPSISMNRKKNKYKSNVPKKKKKRNKNKKASKSHQRHQRFNRDELDNPEIYNAQNNDVGPNVSSTNLPGSAASSKHNIFNNKSKQDNQYKSRQQQPIPAPILPVIPTNNGLSSVAQHKHDEDNNNDELQSHHHKSNISTSSLHSDTNNLSINKGFASPPNIEEIGAIPRPIVPVLSSRFDTNENNTFQSNPDSIKYEVSIVQTPTLDNMDMPQVININEVQYSENDILSEGEPHFSPRRMPSSNINEMNSKNKELHLNTNNLMSSDDSEYGDDDEEDEEGEDDTSDSSSEEDEIYPDIPQEKEKNICIRIAKVLYENSWTGEMISNSTEFSRREYNAILDSGNVPSDSYISNLVWKIIFYSQKKTEDDLINEDKPHIKWYWYDSNDLESDWKWRKYNVIICQWITDEYQNYLDHMAHDTKLHRNSNGNRGDRKYKAHIVNFRECQKKLEKEHEKNTKKNKRNNKQDEQDDDGKDEEKYTETKHDDDDDEDDLKNGTKKKKITIDTYFDKNSNYEHCLMIQRDEFNESNILLWHQIIKTTDNIEYFREIRLEHKLFNIQQDMIVNNYQPNPSPFAIPPQLAAVDS